MENLKAQGLLSIVNRHIVVSTHGTYYALLLDQDANVGCVFLKNNEFFINTVNMFGMANLLPLLPVSYTSRLLMSGLGYRANIINRWLVLRLGYSHLLSRKVMSGACVWVFKRYCLQVSSFSSAKTSLMSENIIDLRKPDVYKGKGVHFLNKVQVLKPGKKE